VIYSVTSEPNYFNPLSNTCLENGDSVKTTYTVSEPVDVIELRIINLANMNTVRVIKDYNVLTGENYIYWNGQNSSGDYVEAGDYQLALKATDSEGNESMLTTANLVRVAY
jgi:flagellar hook assembly protein FlgD